MVLLYCEWLPYLGTTKIPGITICPKKSWYSMVHVQNSWLNRDIILEYYTQADRNNENEIYKYKLHYWKDYMSVWQMRFSQSELLVCWDEFLIIHTKHTQQGDRFSQVRRYMGIITFGDSHLFSLWPYKSLCPTSNMWNCCVCVDSNICLSDGVCHSDLMFRSVWIHPNISVNQIAIDIGILFVVGQFQYNVYKGPYQ